MKEKQIEKYLVEQVERQGGLCLKWVCPGHAGVPDRIVIRPDNMVDFVEIKAPGGTPRLLQMVWHRKLRGLGHTVYVLDSKAAVDEYTGVNIDDDDDERDTSGLLTED